MSYKTTVIEFQEYATLEEFKQFTYRKLGGRNFAGGIGGKEVIGSCSIAGGADCARGTAVSRLLISGRLFRNRPLTNLKFLILGFLNCFTRLVTGTSVVLLSLLARLIAVASFVCL